jgi:AcrR family transcriptional regulator
MARFDRQPPVSTSAGYREPSRDGRQRGQPAEFQRVRILLAMVTVACEHGVQAATVAHVVAQAGVSRKTFYEFFKDRDDCLSQSLERAVGLVSERTRAAYDAGRAWPERVRAALRVILEFLDADQALARLLVIESAAAGPAILARRREMLGHLAELVDDGNRVTRREPLPLAAEAAVGGVFEVIHARLLKPNPGALAELLGQLMSFIVLPYLGTAAAARELSRAATTASPRRNRPMREHDLIEGLPIRLTYRTVIVIAVIAAEPGLSNMQISMHAGVTDQGQMSKLLARLARAGLIENSGAGQNGAPNAWRLTDLGESVERSIKDEQLPLTSRRAMARR